MERSLLAKGGSAFGFILQRTNNQTNLIMASYLTKRHLVWFQRIRATIDERDQKHMLKELDIVMRSSDCPYIVEFYGANFEEVNVNKLYPLKSRTFLRNKDCVCDQWVRREGLLRCSPKVVNETVWKNVRINWLAFITRATVGFAWSWWRPPSIKPTKLFIRNWRREYPKISWEGSLTV